MFSGHPNHVYLFLVFFRNWFFSFLAHSSSRILGGRNVFLGELPYQVSLRYWGTTDHFAGGVVLNSRWVLTTAHGVLIHPGNGIDIILGIIRVDTGESLRSSEIRVHPLFDNILLLNEWDFILSRWINLRIINIHVLISIATIRSSLVIEFSSFVSPISLSPVVVGDGVIAHVRFRWFLYFLLNAIIFIY